MKEIRIKEECSTCGGTGLYAGIGERDGAAVVCQKCKGTGCFEHVHKYEDFKARKERQGVTRVYQTNVGFCIGNGNGVLLEDFGGMPIKDWTAGRRFAPGTEDRAHACPGWWFQCVDYQKKPEWKECHTNVGNTFASCKHFQNKSTCWRRYDAERGTGEKHYRNAKEAE